MNCLSRSLFMKVCVMSGLMIAPLFGALRDDFFDLLVDAIDVTDRSYKVGYDELVLDTYYIVEDIIAEMSNFHMLFSPIHDRSLITMQRLFVAIADEFYPFLQDYEYLYGYSLYEIAALRVVLLDLYDAMIVATVSSRLRYDHELDVIIEFLNGTVLEMRRSLLDLYSIRRVIDNLDHVRHVVATL
ncbi:MAG TPA: hypothetical protein VGT41_02030 [Candidatus Babeliales bacterium]|nr:hypothetical protein [Candidatus Babeliales bacterium]